MAQEYNKFNGVIVAVPDEISVNFATTSTEASGRNQYLVMNNTPIGTIQSYTYKWTRLKPNELSQILKQVINKPSFTLHYLDAYTGTWTDGTFYATEMSSTMQCEAEEEELYSELSFNVIAINPI